MLDFDINKLMETRNKPENIKQLINQNDKDLYNYIDSFLEKESNQIFKNKYDVAIYTVGLSIYPILLSLSTIKPKKEIVLLCSEKSLPYGEIIKTYAFKLGYNQDQIKIVSQIKESDTASIYKVMEEVIKEYSNEIIAIDITGGKKPTIAAGFLGATLFEIKNTIHILYMDFLEYKNDNPIYGSEYLVKLINPSELFSALDFKVLQGLYKSHQYRAARRMSKIIKNNLEQLKASEIYDVTMQINQLEKIYAFSNLYELRTDFSYDKISSLLKQETTVKYLTEEELVFMEDLCECKQKIDQIIEEISKSSKKYRDEDSETELSMQIYNSLKSHLGLYYMALERYESAIRYKEIDYSGYLIRLCSVIELAGILLIGGRSNQLMQKINVLKIIKIKNKEFASLNIDKMISRLHKIRKLRNNSSIIHGFTSINTPDVNYEKDILTYISIAFDKSQKQITHDLNSKVKFKTIESIID